LSALLPQKEHFDQLKGLFKSMVDLNERHKPEVS